MQGRGLCLGSLVLVHQSAGCSSCLRPRMEHGHRPDQQSTQAKS